MDCDLYAWPTKVGKKSNESWQETQLWLAGSRRMASRKYIVGWQKSNMVGKKSDNGCDEVQHGWREVQQWLARCPTTVGKEANNGG